MKKVLHLSVLSALILLPSYSVFADTASINAAFGNLNSTSSNLAGFIRGLTNVVNAVVYLVLAIAVAAFIWGVIEYILYAEPKKKQQGKYYIIWGIIGIAASISILGLANFLIGFFGIEAGSGGLINSDIPSVPYDGSVITGSGTNSGTNFCVDYTDSTNNPHSDIYPNATACNNAMNGGGITVDFPCHSC